MKKRPFYILEKFLFDESKMKEKGVFPIRSNKYLNLFFSFMFYLSFIAHNNIITKTLYWILFKF